MIRTLWIDAGAGAAGDMLLGALVDLGFPAARLREVVLRLDLDGVALRVSRVRRAGLAARKVDVRVPRESAPRDRRAVARVVARAAVAPAVKRRARAVFDRLFAAEAEAHGLPASRVHLHEAGAEDAIVDVVGVCAAVEALGVERVVVSPVGVGRGAVRSAHGLLAVPGPATLRLLRGVPVADAAPEGEALTPTGAALLVTLADAWGPLPAMRPLAIGCGAGSRDTPGRANVVRLVLGEAAADDVAVEGTSSSVAVLESDLDDATPQQIAWACESALAAGALDAVVVPIVMKKSRPGHRLSILARPERLAALVDLVLRETPTLGVRWRLEQRVELERAVERVETPWGAVRVKTGRVGGVAKPAQPEFDDCAALARRRGVELIRVQRIALESGRRGQRDRKPRTARAGSRRRP